MWGILKQYKKINFIYFLFFTYFSNYAYFLGLCNNNTQHINVIHIRFIILHIQQNILNNVIFSI